MLRIQSPEQTSLETSVRKPKPNKPELTRWGNWPIPILCALLLVHIIITVGAAKNDDLEWFDPLIDVRGMVLQDYVEEPDSEDMRNAAIEAMLETLDDPYTVWIPPAQEADFEKQMSGAYVGIGAEIAIENDRLKIITPLENSPSLQAGVRSGDVVLEIEGEDTLGLTSEECIERLLGEEGTPVKILVEHTDGEKENIEIIRRRIRTRTVKGIRRIGEDWNHQINPEKGIGYIRITQFTDRTTAELTEVLNQLLEDGLSGLVLDLRFNGGGTLDGAIDTADLFLGRGAIVSVKDRDGDGRAWTAQDDETDIDVPMIVLVNDASASASEIVAGALQENDRALVLGERTFGKGSVQEVRPLPGQRGTLKLTTARYYLPSGRNLDRTKESKIWGVDPDPGFAMGLDPTEYSDLYKARRAYEAIGEPSEALEGNWNDPDWVETSMKDPQLAGALRSLAARIDDGEWLKVGGDPEESMIRESELADQIAYRTQLLEQLELAATRIAELRTDGEETPESIQFDDAVSLGNGILELRSSDGSVLARFRAENAELLAASLRAAGATPASVEPTTP